MATRLVEKAHLSAKGLIEKARKAFKKVKEPIRGGQGKEKEISITDCLTSALAIFKLKSKKSRLWRRVRGFFEFHVVTSWEALYRAIIQGTRPYAQVIDTS